MINLYLRGGTKWEEKTFPKFVCVNNLYAISILRKGEKGEISSLNASVVFQPTRTILFVQHLVLIHFISTTFFCFLKKRFSKIISATLEIYKNRILTFFSFIFSLLLSNFSRYFWGRY